MWNPWFRTKAWQQAQSLCLHWAPPHNPFKSSGGNAEWSMWMQKAQWVCVTSVKLSFRNSNLLYKRTLSKPIWPSLQREILSVLYLPVSKVPYTPRGYPICIIWDYLPQKHLEKVISASICKISRNKRGQWRTAPQPGYHEWVDVNISAPEFCRHMFSFLLDKCLGVELYRTGRYVLNF